MDTRLERGFWILWSLILLSILLTCAFWWLLGGPSVFRAVTVELGTRQVLEEAFFTADVVADKVAFLTDLETLDLSKPAEHEILIRYDGEIYKTTLAVVDTTAPKADFCDLFVYPGEEIKAEDFVKAVFDLSAVEVRFRKPPQGQWDQKVTVEVIDAGGNRTEKVCLLEYAWLKQAVTVELGDALNPSLFLYDPSRGDIPAQQLAQLEALGTYTLTSRKGERELHCLVTVTDSRGPVLHTQDVEILKGDKLVPEDFLLSSEDPSGVAEVRLLSMPDTTAVGIYRVEIEAVDTLGNKTVVSQSLRVLPISHSPEFAGMEDLLLEKNAQVDYLAGVTAMDAVDGVLEFTVDSSGVDLTVPGTYFVKYVASDSDGNVTEYKRRVTVRPDAQDVDALVREIAGALPDDLIAIRDYVRSSIGYNADWGGEDPVWYGLIQKKGNCYVHALVMQAILNSKGVENQLIWVTGPEGYEYSHYWLIVNTAAGWKHIDPTPRDGHDSYYDLMSDAQRYETLIKDGIFRDWDRTQWPACP